MIKLCSGFGRKLFEKKQKAMRYKELFKGPASMGQKWKTYKQ